MIKNDEMERRMEMAKQIVDFIRSAPPYAIVHTKKPLTMPVKDWRTVLQIVNAVLPRRQTPALEAFTNN
jgi:hypothetical protein